MQKRDTVLLVDDVEMNRAILSGLFKDEYHILEAENGEQALLLLNQCHSSIAIMLLDIVMPVKDGHQVLEEMRETGLLDEVPVIVITADNSLESELRAFDLGASDIIVKPFEPHVVIRRVNNTIELSLHKHNLEALVEEQAEKLRESNEILVDALSSVIEYRNLESGQHIRRIRLLTKVLLKEVERNCPEYGLTEQRIDIISSASAMHDIGKIAIPDSILNKPARLTKEEFEIMKTHTTKGCQILESLTRMSNQEYLHYAYNICRYHHERWDGGGYPDGLVGDAIPICAQAAGIADAYDALTADRVYKKALPHEQAANMILNGECGAFSPRLLECFKSVLSRFAALVQRYADGFIPDKTYDELNGAAPALNFSARSALQLEQMKFFAILRHENCTVLEMDFVTGGYHILYAASRGLQQLFKGRKMSEVVDDGIDSLIHPDDIEETKRIWQEYIPAFFEEGLFKRSWKYRVRDYFAGKWVDYEMTLLRIDIEHPHQRQALVLFKHIGETHNIQNSCTRFKAEGEILLSIMNGMFRCKNDKWFTIEYIDEGFLGYTRSEIKDKFDQRYINIIYPDDREVVKKRLLKQLDVGNRYELEYRVVTKDGKISWMLNRGQLVIDDSGNEVFYSAIIDINRTKQVQEQLRLSFERYKIILEQTNDIIFEWDIAADKVIYSSNWKEKFGYEAISENASALIPTVSHLHPDDMAYFAEFIEKMRTFSRYNELDFRVSDSRGRYKWCRIRATAQLDEMGNPFRVIGVIVDINEAKIATQELKEQAERDNLTKLYNKSAARQKIEEHLARCAEGSDGAVLFVIDLDDFKQINDRYGHMFGDAVLSKVSEWIINVFRGEDIIARIGGDEFMVLIKSALDLDRVRAIGTRFTESFSQALKDLPADCDISASVGIARCPEDGIEFRNLFMNADIALYQAKARGKNMFVIYDDSMGTAALGFNMPREEFCRTKIDSDSMNISELGDLIPGVFRALNRAEDIEKAVYMVLESVGRRLNVSRTYVFENSEDGRFYTNTFEWCNEGVEPQKESLQNMCYDDLSVPYESFFNEKGVFYCNDISVFPEDIYEIINRQGIKSMLQCMLLDDGKFFGWVGLDDCEKDFLWTQEQIDVLSLIAEMLSLFLKIKRSKK